MKEFFKYLKLVLPNLILWAIMIYIFMEFLYTGKLYALSFGELILLATVLVILCLVVSLSCRNTNAINKNKDCFPKDE